MSRKLSASSIAESAASVGSFNFVGLFAIEQLPHAGTVGKTVPSGYARGVVGRVASPPMTRRTTPATADGCCRYPSHYAVPRYPSRALGRKKWVKLTGLKSSLTLLGLKSADGCVQMNQSFSKPPEMPDIASAAPSPVQKAIWNEASQPGGNLPLFDRDGQVVSKQTVQACIGHGWPSRGLPIRLSLTG